MKKVESEPEPKVNSFGSATQLSLTMWLSCESRLIFHEMFSFGPRCIISPPPPPLSFPSAKKNQSFVGENDLLHLPQHWQKIRKEVSNHFQFISAKILLGIRSQFVMKCSTYF